MNGGQRGSREYSRAGPGGHSEDFGLVLNVSDATESYCKKVTPFNLPLERSLWLQCRD